MFTNGKKCINIISVTCYVYLESKRNLKNLKVCKSKINSKDCFK